MRTLLYILILASVLCISCAKPKEFNPLVFVGYVTDSTANIWLEQQAEAYKVQLKDDDHTIVSSKTISNSGPVTFTNLKPNKHYTLFYLKDTLTTFFTPSVDVFPSSYNIAAGSCLFINDSANDRPGKPYGSNEHILDSIALRKPDLMLWLGDNIYLRNKEWQTVEGYLNRYQHTRNIEPMQRLMRSTKHLAIWDDHDFGPNDSDGSYKNKEIALEAFQQSWANPPIMLSKNGNISKATFHDTEIYLLDNRWNRTSAKAKNAAMLGKKQINWLIDHLKQSKATFKLIAVGSQVLSTAAVWENYANFKEERQYLLDKIEENGIQNCIFLTGDRHHTELCSVVLNDSNTVHDITISPLTSKYYTVKPAEITANTALDTSTIVAEHNFGWLKVSGPPNQRKLAVSIYNASGKMQWQREFEAQ